jgi:hypothetical protein
MPDHPERNEKRKKNCSFGLRKATTTWSRSKQRENIATHDDVVK